MQIPPFHDLSPAEQERLALLAEECAEVIQIIGKIWRHGYESTHPDDPEGPTNRHMLETEIGHVQAALDILARRPDLSVQNIDHARREKLNKVQFYLHHNS